MKQIIDQILTILVEECGLEDGGFIWRGLREYDLEKLLRGEFSEYRIQGRLGFGGKLWSFPHAVDPTRRLFVNTYKERLTPEIEQMISRANARLLELDLSALEEA